MRIIYLRNNERIDVQMANKKQFDPTVEYLVENIRTAYTLPEDEGEEWMDRAIQDFDKERTTCRESAEKLWDIYLSTGNPQAEAMNSSYERTETLLNIQDMTRIRSFVMTDRSTMASKRIEVLEAYRDGNAEKANEAGLDYVRAYYGEIAAAYEAEESEGITKQFDEKDAQEIEQAMVHENSAFFEKIEQRPDTLTPYQFLKHLENAEYDRNNDEYNNWTELADQFAGNDKTGSTYLQGLQKAAEMSAPTRLDYYEINNMRFKPDHGGMRSDVIQQIRTKTPDSPLLKPESGYNPDAVEYLDEMYKNFYNTQQSFESDHPLHPDRELFEKYLDEIVEDNKQHVEYYSAPYTLDGGRKSTGKLVEQLNEDPSMKIESVRHDEYVLDEGRKSTGKLAGLLNDEDVRRAMESSAAISGNDAKGTDIITFGTSVKTDKFMSVPTKTEPVRVRPEIDKIVLTTDTSKSSYSGPTAKWVEEKYVFTRDPETDGYSCVHVITNEKNETFVDDSFYKEQSSLSAMLEAEKWESALENGKDNLSISYMYSNGKTPTFDSKTMNNQQEFNAVTMTIVENAKALYQLDPTDDKTWVQSAIESSAKEHEACVEASSKYEKARLEQGVSVDAHQRVLDNQADMSLKRQRVLDYFSKGDINSANRAADEYTNALALSVASRYAEKQGEKPVADIQPEFRSAYNEFNENPLPDDPKKTTAYFKAVADASGKGLPGADDCKPYMELQEKSEVTWQSVLADNIKDKMAKAKEEAQQSGESFDEQAFIKSYISLNEDAKKTAKAGCAFEKAEAEIKLQKLGEQKYEAQQEAGVEIMAMPEKNAAQATVYEKAHELTGKNPTEQVSLTDPDYFNKPTVLCVKSEGSKLTKVGPAISGVEATRAAAEAGKNINNGFNGPNGPDDPNGPSY